MEALPTTMSRLGLSNARDLTSAAYATSLHFAQELKLRILGNAEENSPPSLQPGLLPHITLFIRVSKLGCVEVDSQTDLTAQLGS